MRYLILSDVHSNLEALETVLKALRKEVDAFICLGDIVGYGPNPNECCEMMEELGMIGVAGNHDWGTLGRLNLSHFNPYAAEAIIWTRDNLDIRHRDFLASLPEEEVREKFTLVHGSLVNPLEEYILSGAQARASFLLLTTPILFVGHTHLPQCYIQKEGETFCFRFDFPSGGEIKIRKGYRYLINVGSVGQPRDNVPLASVGIYDEKAKKVTIKRLEYPFTKTQEKIREAGLPSILATRLGFGW